jgi:hypothetical protein
MNDWYYKRYPKLVWQVLRVNVEERKEKAMKDSNWKEDGRSFAELSESVFGEWWLIVEVVFGILFIVGIILDIRGSLFADLWMIGVGVLFVVGLIVSLFKG